MRRRGPWPLGGPGAGHAGLGLGGARGDDARDLLGVLHVRHEGLGDPAVRGERDDALVHALRRGAKDLKEAAPAERHLAAAAEDPEGDEAPADETVAAEAASGADAVASDAAVAEAAQAAMTAEEAITELRTQIDRLGPVNMMAIQQFTEMDERRVFLSAQRKDLIDSIAQTNEAIKRIDETTHTRFREAFTAINAKLWLEHRLAGTTPAYSLLR